MNSKSIFDSKHLFPIAFFSSIFGATVYGVAVIVYGNFNPILSTLAGFAGCLGLAVLEILSMKKGVSSRDSAPLSTILFYGLFGLFALYVGFVILYIYLNVGIGESVSPIEVLSFNMFVSGKIGMIDVLLAFVGATLAYFIPFAFSFKNMDK
ncbi:MAG: hypothetical protein Q7J10_09320 [Methanosarcinaceae archaeon]|nr:hypothetical protein [Methanosarcinaceae archaeon]